MSTVDENNSTDSVAYSCPYCHQSVAIEPHLLGESVDCPECGQRFKVGYPTARPANAATKPGEKAATVEHSADDEATLITVHPVMFRKSPVQYSLVVAMILGGLAWGISSTAFGNAAFFSLSVIGGLGLMLVGAIIMAAWWIKVLAVTLSVTSKRVILTRGILAKQSTEVQHDDVRNIQVDQTVWERIFNVGDLAVSSSGQDDLEVVVEAIPDPSKIVELIRHRQ